MIGTSQQIIAWLFRFQGDIKKRFEIKEYRERRSLSQNSYYWVLCGEVAKKTSVSSAKIHNENLRALGLVERIEDRLITVSLPDTDAAERQAGESMTYHLKPTGQTRRGRDGVMYRTYVMLRGSSTFNTEEMSALLDLMIQEAQAQDIETMTPMELEELRQYELQRQTRKSNRHSADGEGNRMGA